MQKTQIKPFLDEGKELTEQVIATTIAEQLTLWFAKEKRDLPWRRTYDPYSVWVSEIMLQQTQMDRGVVYFERWMTLFPTLESVAKASTDEILRAWEGLGYYSRALNLQKTAKILVSQYSGAFPQDIKTLCSLPGVGAYTAGAIASIAFNKPEIAVDANVERVFARLFDVAMPPKSPVAAGFIRQMAELVVGASNPREINQAIMEFGALICRKKPKCELCPLQNYCHAWRLGLVAERPVLGKRVTITALQVVSGVLVYNGHIFLQKRLPTGVWASLWEFPGGRIELDEKATAAISREIVEETGFQLATANFLGAIKHSRTRYRIELASFLCTLSQQSFSLDEQGMPKPELTAATEYCWALPEDIASFPLPAVHRKLLERFAKSIQQLASESTLAQ